MTDMKAARAGSLFMAWAFSIISMSVGLNALIKSNQAKSKLRSQAPAGTILDINVNDIYHFVIVVAVALGFIFITTTIYLICLLVPSLSSKSGPRTYRLQAVILALWGIWLLALQIVFDIFFSTRSAKVRAFVGNIELPPQVIQSVQQQLGATSVYKDMGYLRLFAILPWIAFLFTAISVVVLLMSASQADQTAPNAETTFHLHNTVMAELGQEKKKGWTFRGVFF